MKPILHRKKVKEVQIRIGPALREISEEELERLLSEILGDEEQ